jgi:hypothetical protein
VLGFGTVAGEVDLLRDGVIVIFPRVAILQMTMSYEED